MTAASLNPEEFVEGGGLIDDVDVVFINCLFAHFDYNGTVIPPAPCLQIDMETEDDEEITQYFSMGNPEDWSPSEDGTQLEATGKATGIRSTSNGGIFLKAMIDAGFPVDKIGDDISVLNGMKCHVIQIPAPKRSGLVEKKRDDGKKFEKTILVISEIHSLPWEEDEAPAKGKTKAKAGGTKGKTKPATKTKAKAKAKPEAAEDEGGDDDIGGKAVAAILEILGDAGTITKKELPAKIFQILKADPDRNAVVKMVFDDEFLGEGPWEYDDGTLVSA
jgi:hypothetical protein